MRAIYHVTFNFTLLFVVIFLNLKRIILITIQIQKNPTELKAMKLT